MLTVFRKIWKFSIKEQKNIKFSIFFALLNAIFNSFQFGAIYYILNKIFTNTLETRDALIVFLICLLYTSITFLIILIVYKQDIIKFMVLYVLLLIVFECILQLIKKIK